MVDSGFIRVVNAEIPQEKCNVSEKVRKSHENLGGAEVVKKISYHIWSVHIVRVCAHGHTHIHTHTHIYIYIVNIYLCN